MVPFFWGSASLERLSQIADKVEDVLFTTSFYYSQLSSKYENGVREIQMLYALFFVFFFLKL